AGRPPVPTDRGSYDDDDRRVYQPASGDLPTVEPRLRLPFCLPLLSPSPPGPVPPGPPPPGRESPDRVVGTGPAVTTSDTVSVQYVGVAWSTGKQFDASWNDGSGQPVTFALSGVIPGWTAGMVGMKAGGRRELIIPPNLAYGANPQAGSGIAAN